jgi:hypothetical protein
MNVTSPPETDADQIGPSVGQDGLDGVDAVPPPPDIRRGVAARQRIA